MKSTIQTLAGMALLSITVLSGCGSAQQAATSTSVNSSATNVATANATSESASTVGNSSISSETNDTSPAAGVGSGSSSAQSSTVPTSSIGSANGSTFSKLGAKSLVAVSFATENSGYVASANAIYHTADGGKNWVKVYTSSDKIIGLDAKYEPQGKIENVVAYTKSNLLWSTSGPKSRQAFHKQALPSKASSGGMNIQSISLRPDGTIWLVNNGKVWVSGGMDGSITEATPSATIQSVAAVSANTAYASSENTIYKTTDHGKSWTKVYSAPLQTGDAPWKSEVQVQGNHVAAYFYGGAAGMSQVAFILYESNDAGKTWNPMVDEGYYAQAYGSPKVLVQKNVGGQPGPFQLLPNGNVVFTGLDVTTDSAMVTTFTPKGEATGPYKLSNISLDVFQNPVDIAAPTSTHYVLTGGKNGKAVLATSSDAGKSWKLG